MKKILKNTCDIKKDMLALIYLLLIGSQMSKFRILCIAAACAISANAASPMKKMPKGLSGWGIGSQVRTSNGESYGGIALDNKSENYEYGFTTGARFNKSNVEDGESWNELDLGGYLGARNRLQKNFAISSGAEVRTVLCDKWSAYGNAATPMDSMPYAVSFYSQLSHETKVSSCYARLALISYEDFGVSDLNNEVNVASNVTIGMNYYFQR